MPSGVDRIAACRRLAYVLHMQSYTRRTLAGGGEEPFELQLRAQCGAGHHAGQIAYRQCRQRHFDVAGNAGLDHIRGVRKQHVQNRNAGRRIPEWLAFKHQRIELQLIQREQTTVLADRARASSESRRSHGAVH